MITLNCFTNGFAGQPSTVPGKKPQDMQWIYGEKSFDGITIFEGMAAFESRPADIDSRYKVAWLTEGQCLRGEMYGAIQLIDHHFDRVLTHSTTLVARNPHKYKLMPRMGCRIPREMWGVNSPRPNKAVICVGDKSETSGHQLRHAIAKRLGGLSGLDIYYTYEREKILTKYQIAIVVEACAEGVMFSEHLLDALACGCVCFYAGSLYVKEWIPTEAIIPFASTIDLSRLLQSPFNYNHYLGELDNVLSYVDQYEIPEDWMVRNVLADYLREVH